MFQPKAIFPSLAKQYGTPLYVYDEAVLLNQLEILRREIPAEIRFAVKANSNLQILKILQQKGCGFDVVSGGEIQRVLAAGGESSKIVFSGVGKTDQEINLALDLDLQAINVESKQELEVINQLAHARSKIARIALRINPDISAATHPYLNTGAMHSKFGIEINVAKSIIERFEQDFKSLKLVGIASHIGSQILDDTALIASHTAIIAAANSLGHNFEFIDLGGGFGIPYAPNQAALNLSSIGEALRQASAAVPLIIEPGRFIVGACGVLLTKVLYTKINAAGRKIVVVDAGMNDQIRPSLYSAQHHFEVCKKPETIETVDLVGPVCESGCIFANDLKLNRAERGDIIAMFTSGAYGSVMSSNYNTRALPAEVLIGSDDSHRLIRKRQEIAAIWREEILT